MLKILNTSLNSVLVHFVIVAVLRHSVDLESIPSAPVIMLDERRVAAAADNELDSFDCISVQFVKPRTFASLFQHHITARSERV